ncbi:hypothetical protein BGLA2_80059 [Burkholderia gladioli]|nr:hypothetical protein BGLA2_80059 [Burkholderia gladioli]
MHRFAPSGAPRGQRHAHFFPSQPGRTLERQLGPCLGRYPADPRCDVPAARTAAHRGGRGRCVGAPAPRARRRLRHRRHHAGAGRDGQRRSGRRLRRLPRHRHLRADAGPGPHARRPARPARRPLRAGRRADTRFRAGRLRADPVALRRDVLRRSARGLREPAPRGGTRRAAALHCLAPGRRESLHDHRRARGRPAAARAARARSKPTGAVRVRRPRADDRHPARRGLGTHRDRAARRRLRPARTRPAHLCAAARAGRPAVVRGRCANPRAGDRDGVRGLRALPRRRHAALPGGMLVGRGPRPGLSPAKPARTKKRPPEGGRSTRHPRSPIVGSRPATA